MFWPNRLGFIGYCYKKQPEIFFDLLWCAISGWSPSGAVKNDRQWHLCLDMTLYGRTLKGSVDVILFWLAWKFPWNKRTSRKWKNSSEKKRSGKRKLKMLTEDTWKHSFFCSLDGITADQTLVRFLTFWSNQIAVSHLIPRSSINKSRKCQICWFRDNIYIGKCMTCQLSTVANIDTVCRYAVA